jgi:cytochrome c oxidase cbb3-type subunit 3
MFFTSYLVKKARKLLMALSLLLITAVPAMADGPTPPSSLSNPFVTLMVIIIVFLALIIFMMGRVVIGSGELYLEKWKKESAEEKKKNSAAPVVTTIVLLMVSLQVFAQDKTAAAATNDNYSGVTPTAYYLLSSVVFIELLLIAVLLYMLRVFAGIQKKKKAIIAQLSEAPDKNIDTELSWWDKFNALKPLQQEVDIDLGHSYDGIRELDNRLPPWWVWGFVLTIVFAMFYLYTHYVSHTAMSNIEEYQASVKQAEIDKAEYLKKSANNVDETTVKLLTGDGDIAAGKQIFQTSCFPCHGKNGEGIVGPNLTDDYWLHGGSIQDVFKTIKYGWVDKGMKSWKDDYSPVQIAQIASYVKSLHGTNPPNAKPPQGTLYSEAGTAPAVKKDSVQAKKS